MRKRPVTFTGRFLFSPGVSCDVNNPCGANDYESTS